MIRNILKVVALLALATTVAQAEEAFTAHTHHAPKPSTKLYTGLYVGLSFSGGDTNLDKSGILFFVGPTGKVIAYGPHTHGTNLLDNVDALHVSGKYYGRVDKLGNMVYTNSTGTATYRGNLYTGVTNENLPIIGQYVSAFAGPTGTNFFTFQRISTKVLPAAVLKTPATHAH